MASIFKLAAAAAVLCALGATAAEARVKHHHQGCNWQNCTSEHRHHPAYQRNILDGTEPLCGFNDGTYLRNALECGFR